MTAKIEQMRESINLLLDALEPASEILSGLHLSVSAYLDGTARGHCFLWHKKETAMVIVEKFPGLNWTRFRKGNRVDYIGANGLIKLVLEDAEEEIERDQTVSEPLFPLKESVCKETVEVL